MDLTLCPEYFKLKYFNLQAARPFVTHELFNSASFLQEGKNPTKINSCSEQLTENAT